MTTLGAIRTAIRQRADMVNSQFITDAEFNSYINASYYELYDLIAQKFGDAYYASSSTFTTDGVSQSFALPIDFYKLLGVDLAVAATPSGYITLKRFEFIDRNAFSAPNMLPIYGITNIRYRLHAANLFFTPIPAGGQTIRVWYVPRLTALVNDSDTVDGVSGWEELIIVDCCIKAWLKQESDVSAFMALKAQLVQRLEAAAENRDVGQPPVISDVQSSAGWWPGMRGPGAWGPY